MQKKIKHAFLLAAGFGTRMKELTNEIPKPMLKVGKDGFKVPLIIYSLYTLKKMGVENVVVNTHYKAGQIESLLKKVSDNSELNISVSYEPEILGTAGGLKKALIEKKIHKNRNFILLNTDLIMEPLPESLPEILQTGTLSYMYLKEKENSNNETGWDLNQNHQIRLNRENGQYYYVGFSIINPELLASVEPGKSAELGPLWIEASKQKRITGEKYPGRVISCGNKEEYENIKDKTPAFLEDDEEFEEFRNKFANM